MEMCMYINAGLFGKAEEKLQLEVILFSCDYL